MKKIKSSIVILCILLLTTILLYQHNKVTELQAIIKAEDIVENITLDINGKTDEVKTLIYEDIVYIPLKHIENTTDKEFNWDLGELKLTLSDIEEPEVIEPEPVDFSTLVAEVTTEADKLHLNYQLRKELEENNNQLVQLIEIDNYLKNLNEQLDVKEVIGKGEVIDKMVNLPIKDYDEKEVQKIISRISNLDYALLKVLEANETTIYLTNGLITDIPKYSYLKGQNPRGWGEEYTWEDVSGLADDDVAIRIGYSEPGEHHGSLNLELHEIAHTVDLVIFNKISQKNEFLDIWQQETNIIFANDDYTGEYPEEYFAECFAYYYLSDEHNEILKTKAPSTHGFIKNLADKAYKNYGYLIR